MKYLVAVRFVDDITEEEYYRPVTICHTLQMAINYIRNSTEFPSPYLYNPNQEYYLFSLEQPLKARYLDGKILID